MAVNIERVLQLGLTLQDYLSEHSVKDDENIDIEFFMDGRVYSGCNGSRKKIHEVAVSLMFGPKHDYVKQSCYNVFQRKKTFG